MSDLIVAIGLVLAIEGTLYALMPHKLKAMMLQMQATPDQVLRTGGLVAVAVGVLLVWLVRG